MAALTKDARIIKENPGKTIHEYRLLGVSEKKLEELQSIEDAKEKLPIPKAKEVQKAEPVVVKNEKFRAQPAAKMYVPAPNNDMVTVVEVSTQKRTPMSRKFGERLVKKNPKTHRLE